MTIKRIYCVEKKNLYKYISRIYTLIYNIYTIKNCLETQEKMTRACIVASLVAQLLKNLPARPRPGFYSWVGKIPWRRERLPTPIFWPGEFHGQYSL